MDGLGGGGGGGGGGGQRPTAASGMVHVCCLLSAGVSARRASFFFTIPHLCLFLPSLTKQPAPKKAGLMEPLLICSPSFGDP